MNYELIQELAYEAEDRADRLVDEGSEFHREYTILLSKMIVNECIDLLNKRFMGDLNREDMEVKRCVEDIKKHFGVD